MAELDVMAAPASGFCWRPFEAACCSLKKPLPTNASHTLPWLARWLKSWPPLTGEVLDSYRNLSTYDWQTFDVVTCTYLDINFDAKTFHHHYYPRQVKVPPFVTIGTEVEH